MKTDWIVYGIVAFAAFYILKSIFWRKGKKGCCGKGCGANPPKPGSAPKKDGPSCH